MTGEYDDIINLPHHVSKTRQPMSMLERAAQFSVSGTDRLRCSDRRQPG